jgi:hypothetical protein
MKVALVDHEHLDPLAEGLPLQIVKHESEEPFLFLDFPDFLWISHEVNALF